MTSVALSTSLTDGVIVQFCRYRAAGDVSQLSDTLGRAQILVCTECGVAIHVMDAEAHSLSCKATPRFPLPSQVGYHSDGQDVLRSPQMQHHPVPLSITYPSPSALASPTEMDGMPQGVPRSGQKKVRYKRRLKTEPPDQLLQPKLELTSDGDEVMNTSPVKTYDDSPSLSHSEVMGTAGLGFTPDSQPIKKKAKVMLPSLDSPRGVRTLLPG